MLTENGVVELKIGKGADQVTKSKGYTKVTFEMADIPALFSGDEKETALAALNYGYDLKVRAKVRQQLEKESAGPEKSFEKLVTTLIANAAAMGKTLTREKAIERAKRLQEELDED